MSANVDVATHFYTAVIRNMGAHWSEPRSYTEDLREGRPDAKTQEALDLLHPEVRWTDVLGTVSEGKLACTNNSQEMLESSQFYALELLGVTGLTETHVLVSLRAEMHGRESGAAGSVLVFMLLRLQEGLIIEMTEYLDRGDALRAAGVELDASE